LLIIFQLKLFIVGVVEGYIYHINHVTMYHINHVTM